MNDQKQSYENTKKAYREISKVLNKYKEIVAGVFDIPKLENKARAHLFGIELVEKYGFEIDPKGIHSTEFQELMDNVRIGFYDGERRKISYPDDGEQPENEMLLCLKFHTGAYLFGGDYPAEFFQKFFLELKTYEPKYVDSHNSSLYFSLDNAGRIHNAYPGIFKRYCEENKKDLIQREIKRLEGKLAELKKNKGQGVR